MASIPRIITGSSTVSNASHHEPVCHPSAHLETAILLTISTLGIVTNGALILLVSLKKPSKRYHQTWSQGLLLHQGLVDLIRAAILIYLAMSVMLCQRLSKCFLVDTAFLLLVSVSTVNMLTMLINDAPIFPEHEQLGSITAAVSGAQRLRPAQSWMDVTEQIDINEGSIESSVESPYCIVFAVFIIWFSCLTIHLGPTFLSGGLTSSDGGHLDVCSMVYKPVRHYVLNVLWVLVNLMCASLMAIHLRKLYKDIIKSNSEAARLATLVTTMIPLRSQVDEMNQQHFHGYIRKLEAEGSSRVRMFIIVLAVYLACWAPLYIVTLLKPDLGSSFSYEITIHLAFAHSFINPLLFLVMYRNLLHNETRRFADCTDCDSCCWCNILTMCIEGRRPREEETFHLNHHHQSMDRSRVSQLHALSSRSPLQRPLVSLIDLKSDRAPSPPLPLPRQDSVRLTSMSSTPVAVRSLGEVKLSSSSCNMASGYERSSSSLRRAVSAVQHFTDVISDENNVTDETYPESDTCIVDASRQTRKQAHHHHHHHHHQQQQQQQQPHQHHHHHHRHAIDDAGGTQVKHYIGRSIQRGTSTSPDSLVEGESSVNCSPSHLNSNVKSNILPSVASSSSSSHLHLSSHRLPHPLPDPVTGTNSTLVHQSHSKQNLVQLQLHTHTF